MNGVQSVGVGADLDQIRLIVLERAENTSKAKIDQFTISLSRIRLEETSLTHMRASR